MGSPKGCELLTRVSSLRVVYWWTGSHLGASGRTRLRQTERTELLLSVSCLVAVISYQRETDVCHFQKGYCVFLQWARQHGDDLKPLLSLFRLRLIATYKAEDLPDLSSSAGGLQLSNLDL